MSFSARCAASGLAIVAASTTAQNEISWSTATPHAEIAFSVATGEIPALDHRIRALAQVQGLRVLQGATLGVGVVTPTWTLSGRGVIVDIAVRVSVMPSASDAEMTARAYCDDPCPGWDALAVPLTQALIVGDSSAPTPLASNDTASDPDDGVTDAQEPD